MKKNIGSRIACAIALLSSGAALAAHPDFTGIWDPHVVSPPGAATLADGGRALRSQARNDERAGFLRNAPFTPALRARVEEYTALVAPTGGTPGAFCLAHGMPAAMLGTVGYPMEIIQRPEQLTIIHELHAEIRRIYTDGRKIDPAERVPERSGFSVGRWEGDTLVVTTTSLSEVIDEPQPHSENATITERISVTGTGAKRVLTDELTLTDPDFYSRPVTFKVHWVPSKSKFILSYDCNEPVWEEHLEQLRRQRQERK